MAERWKEDLMPYLSDGMRSVLRGVPPGTPVEELRLRVNQPIQLVCFNSERLIYGPKGRPALQKADLDETVSRICQQSVYAYSEELASGFLTLSGGYRVGITGRCILENERVLRLTDATSINIRIPRAVRGSAEEAVASIAAGGVLQSTLILSEPGAGKTTFLRELIRLASTGGGILRPQKVSVVDTRAELSGTLRGAAVFDLGPRTDVRTGGDKASGLSAMLMAMSPEILATDEIGSFMDARAVLDARFAGVTVLATAHANQLDELGKRLAFRELVAARAFDRYVVLSRHPLPGTIAGIYDANGKSVCGQETTWQRCLQC